MRMTRKMKLYLILFVHTVIMAAMFCRKHIIHLYVIWEDLFKRMSLNW